MSDVTLLTVEEVADRWRVSKMTVYRMCHSGVLESIRIGNSYRIHHRAVLDYEDRMSTKKKDDDHGTHQSLQE